MRVSVIVPTYRRVEDLKRCLESICVQTEAPYELIVVYRDTDAETVAFLLEWVGNDHPFQKRLVAVDVPGQVQALSAGVEAATGEVVAFTDDDAAPRPDWISLLSSHYVDAKVGGVGGRDIVHHVAEIVPASKPTVGLITWYGRVVGNHHIGFGAARRVQILKGANMSFRRDLITFDQGLRGEGAQPHNDMALSLTVSTTGWKLIYDPSILVDHYPAVRHDSDRRIKPSWDAMENSAFNLAYVLKKYLPFPRRQIRIVYGVLFGDAGTPGLGRAVVAVFRGERRVLRALLPSLSGQVRAIFGRADT